MSVAVGYGAGQTRQGDTSVAIGHSAGNDGQNTDSVAIGHFAGEIGQGFASIAVGYSAGNDGQGSNAVAIGNQAGKTDQGVNSIAIGAYSNASANSICLNASGSAMSYVTEENAFYVNPIRYSGNTSNILGYDTTTKEVVYTGSTGFVNNPMTSSLIGGNYDITNVGSIGAVTSTLSGNFTVGGDTTLNGLTNVLKFRDVTYNAPDTYGTRAVPIIISPGGLPSSTSSFDMLDDNRSVLIYAGAPAGTGTQTFFNIFTDIVNVLDHYVVEVNLVHIDRVGTVFRVDGLGISSQLSSPTPPDNKNFGVIITGNFVPAAGDVFKIAVRLIKTD